MPGMPGLAQGIPSVIHLSVVGVEGQDVEAQQLVCMNFDQARRLWKVGAVAHCVDVSGAAVCPTRL